MHNYNLGHSHFLDKLLTKVISHSDASNPLVKSLEVMANDMGIALLSHRMQNINELRIDTVHRYQEELGILLYQAAVHPIHEMAASLYPTLLQFSDSDTLYVLLRTKFGRVHLYNSLTNKYETIACQKNLSVSKAWQCCPTGLTLPINFSGLLGAAFNLFRRNMVNAILLGIIISIFTLLVSMVSAYVFCHSQEINRSGYSLIFFAFLSVSICALIFSFVNDLYIKTLNTKILFYLLPSLWNHVFKLPIQTTQKYVSGELVQRLFDYEAAISTIIITSLSSLFSFASLLCLLGYMAYCNLLLAMIYTGVCLLLTSVKLLLTPKNIQYITAQLAEQSRLSHYLNECLIQIHKIRSANIEVTVFKKWLANLIGVKSYAEKLIKIEILIWSIESIVPIALLLAFYAILYFSTTRLDSYVLLQFMICAGQFSGIFEKLSVELSTLIHLLPNLKRMQPIISEKTENYIQNKIDIKGEIRFAHVNYRDRNTGNSILEDISIDIKPGQFIALIGQSGAGKSSIFKLLLGFERPTSGLILVDNENIANLNMTDIRKQFGVVLQTTSILPGTIFSNISVNTTLTHDEAWQLARYVGLDEDISNMPMKMYTHISDNAGESISGGQKQKILIARALATHPKLLLLDEATSALDNKSQATIYNNLKMLNITRFVIAHRHSTIIDADMIYVIDKGKVVNKGTYADLFK